MFRSKPTIRPAAMSAGAVLLAFVTGLVLIAPSGETLAQATEASTVAMWIEATDSQGQPIEDLKRSDLEVYSNGDRLPTEALHSARPERVVLYFDQILASGGTLLRAAQALGERAADLAQLGPVTVLTADPQPTLASAADDPLLLEQRLSWIAANSDARGRLLEVRQAALDRLRPVGDPPGLDDVLSTVRQAVEEEREVVQAQLRHLLAWAAAEPLTGPGLLILCHDGFDLDPLTFYLQHLPEEATSALLRGALELPTFESLAEGAAQALSGLGWTVLAVPLEAEAAERAGGLGGVTASDGSGGQSVVPGVRVRPGAIRRQRQARAEEELRKATAARLVAPAKVLQQLAEATGGELVASASGLRESLRRLRQRKLLGVQLRQPGLAPVQVASRRENLQLRAPKWVLRGTPTAAMEARMAQLLAGDAAGGALDVAAALSLAAGGRGELETRLNLRALAAEAEPGQTAGDSAAEDSAAEDSALGARPTLRLAIGLAGPGDSIEVREEIIADADLGSAAEWVRRTSLDLPADVRQVAVVAEEVDRGLWGGTVAAVLQSSWTESATGVLAAPPVIELLPPDDPVLRGRVRFEVEIYDPRVARVVYELNDRQVAERERAPFNARLDLGRTPRRQALTGIAFDQEGQELGRDTVLLNAGSAGFAVRMVEPREARGTGPIDFEAEVVVPAGRQVDRVLFFWNSEPVSTLFRAPFRQRILVPSERPEGYARVVAMLDDGTVGEDVLFMNGPGIGERVEVSLVELNVVVVDRQGRPVRGLSRDDFRLEEDGRRQEIAAFSDAAEVPLTLGMAIDSSASMFVKLPRVQAAAQRFLRSTFNEGDRAFVVDFDSRPRLARGPTAELARLEDAISRLEPNGRTALWESVVFSLVQLQGVRGRKALVVFTDGADEDDEFPFRACLRFAKKTGVPIYLILMQREPKDPTGLSLWGRSFASRVDRLLGAVGGRVYYARDYEDLDTVYAQIEEELRSQYLLAYYPAQESNGSNGSSGAWRDVEVKVQKRGLTPRTLSGYWP